MKAEFEAAKQKLEKFAKFDVSKLESKKAKLQAQIAQLEKEVADIDSEIKTEYKAAGITLDEPKGKRGAKAKKQGILVTLDALKKRIAAADGKTLSIRKEGIDTPCVKALVDANPDVLVYEAGQWPKVSLKK